MDFLHPNLGPLKINQLLAFNHRILFLILSVEVKEEEIEEEVGAVVDVEVDAEVKTMEEDNLIFVILLANLEDAIILNAHLLIHLTHKV